MRHTPHSKTLIVKWQKSRVTEGHIEKRKVKTKELPKEKYINIEEGSVQLVKNPNANSSLEVESEGVV